MVQSKYIVMWIVLRSCFILIVRIFEQLDECWLIDEFFYLLYVLKNDFGEFERKVVLELFDINY